MNAISTTQSSRLRGALIVLILLGSAAASVLAANGSGLIALAALVAGSVGIFLFRFRPVRYIVLFSSAFLAILPGGIPVSLLLLVGLAFLWLAKRVIRRLPLNIEPSRTLKLAFLFAIVAVLAALAGQLPWFPIPGASIEAQLGGLGIFVFLMLAFFVGAQLVEDVEVLRSYTWFFLAITGTIILAASLPVVRGVVVNVFSVASGGSMAGIWFTSIAASQAMMNTDLKPKWRWLLILAAIGYLAGTYLGNRSWASGWLPSLMAFAVIIWFFKPRLRVLTAAGGLIAALFIWQQFGTELLAENQYSLDTRLAAAESLIDIISVNPVLGTGPANYYWYAALYPILGFQVQFNSHNQYVDILAQTGIAGLVVFIWLLARLFITGAQLFNAPASHFARAYGLGVVGGVTGMVVAGFLGDWLIPFFYNVGMRGFGGSMLGWFFLGGLVLLERNYLRNKI